MYVKILKLSPLGKQLQEIWDKSFECDKAALEWAKQQGADYIRGEYFCLGGGISTAHFNSKPPKGWVKAGSKYPEGEYLISSTSSGKELRVYEKALPRVTQDEFNKIIKYDWRKKTTKMVSFHPGISFQNKKYILLDFADHTTYAPIDGMEEITISEYKALTPAKEMDTIK